MWIGALLVYDVTDLDSFEKVKTWYFELRKYIPKDWHIYNKFWSQGEF